MKPGGRPATAELFSLPAIEAKPLPTATCPDLKLNQRGNIVANEYGQTSIPGVFAGGDIVRGAATVMPAMGDGKKAASGMDHYLKVR